MNFIFEGKVRKICNKRLKPNVHITLQISNEYEFFTLSF